MKNEISISESASLKEALKKLNKTAKKVLIVVDGQEKVVGTVSDGDIRRLLLKGNSLDEPLGDAYNPNFTHLFKDSYEVEQAKAIMLKKRIELLPILNSEFHLVDFVTWDQVFSEKKIAPRKRKGINIPVVIMAGGKGTRLEPFTKILPKPLIPIRDTPIVEHIIEEFGRNGISDYYLTLNYRGEMIKAYFNSIEKNYKLRYVWEKEYCGTAGCLKLLEKSISDTFIVSNCDIIVRADYSDVLKFHTRQKAAITILSSIQHFKIPYGVVKFKAGGYVTEITEKPEYTFSVNTGVYVMTRECLRHIPKDTFFDMPTLISALMACGKKVLTYPVNEDDYIDIGQWEESQKAVTKLSFV